MKGCNFLALFSPSTACYRKRAGRARRANLALLSPFLSPPFIHLSLLLLFVKIEELRRNQPF
jgi:hypothetical protein